MTTLDVLTAAWLLLFVTSPLWIMFLVPFFSGKPLRRVLFIPAATMGGVIALGGVFFALGGGAGGLLLIGLGLALGLLMLVSGLLGLTVRTLFVDRQFTIRSLMIAIALFAFIFSVARLFTSFSFGHQLSG